MKPYTGPPATPRQHRGAGARIIVWCRDCRHEIEPDPAELASRYGADTSVLGWRERLVSRCGSREIDMVLTGTKS
jgi:hypothetical protein